MVYTVIAALAEHERSRLSERTKQGLRSAVRRGQVLGRKPKLNIQQVLLAKDKIESGIYTKPEMAALYGIHPRTLSPSIKRIMRKSVKQITSLK